MKITKQVLASKNAPTQIVIHITDGDKTVKGVGCDEEKLIKELTAKLQGNAKKTTTKAKAKAEPKEAGETEGAEGTDGKK